MTVAYRTPNEETNTCPKLLLACANVSVEANADFLNDDEMPVDLNGETDEFADVVVDAPEVVVDADAPFSSENNNYVAATVTVVALCIVVACLYQYKNGKNTDTKSNDNSGSTNYFVNILTNLVATLFGAGVGFFAARKLSPKETAATDLAFYNAYRTECLETLFEAFREGTFGQTKTNEEDHLMRKIVSAYGWGAVGATRRQTALVQDVANKGGPSAIAFADGTTCNTYWTAALKNVNVKHDNNPLQQMDAARTYDELLQQFKIAVTVYDKIRADKLKGEVDPIKKEIDQKKEEIAKTNDDAEKKAKGDELAALEAKLLAAIVQHDHKVIDVCSKERRLKENNLYTCAKMEKFWKGVALFADIMDAVKNVVWRDFK